MMLTLLKGKLHRATVTGSELNYEGSITVDRDLLDAAGILQYEQVDVLNINNGERFTTYAIDGARGTGQVTVNGAAARKVQKGDLVIICAFCAIDSAEATLHKPKVVLLEAANRIKAF